MKRFVILSIAAAAMAMLSACGAKKSENMEKEFVQIFPQGNPLPEKFSQYFIGQAYLAPLSDNDALGTHISNVTFEPACRNNWHSHTGGQLLIATAGRGFYQERGKAARELHAGDIVEIPADVEHWHGAAPDSWFSHLAVECNPATNVNTWLEPVDDGQYAAATGSRVKFGFGDKEAGCPDAAHKGWARTSLEPLRSDDPELAEILGRFAFGDVNEIGDIDLRTQLLATLASTVAQNTVGELRIVIRAALDAGIAPLEIKETIYHAVPYVGIARVRDCLEAANETLRSAGVALPTAGQSVVTAETRFDEGLALQRSLFGSHIDAGYASSPADLLHIHKFLSANCFGDYQTRPALDPATRELLTYAILISLGGCEPQVKGHIRGNLNAGNDRAKLIAVTTRLLPYIGYPRTLNALQCLKEVAPEK